MDIWKAYIKGSEEMLPNGQICHDKFHLVKYINDAVDKVRGVEEKTKEELPDTIYIWLKFEAIPMPYR